MTIHEAIPDANRTHYVIITDKPHTPLVFAQHKTKYNFRYKKMVKNPEIDE
jgi:hypothetical protein